MDRRTFVRTSAGIGAATSISMGVIPGTAAADPDGSVIFGGQLSDDGTTIVVDEISTDVTATLLVRNRDADETLANITIEPGTYEDYEIDIDPPVTERSEVMVGLYPEGGGEGFGRDSSIVGEFDGEYEEPEYDESAEGTDYTLIDPDPTNGFNYPFYLYTPDTTSSGDSKPILVEPVNTGTATDEFDQHREAAEETVELSSTRDIVDELGVPLVVPIFPRPESEPVNWSHYVHQLDDTTMELTGGPLERVDLQLLNMVEAAQEHLADDGFPVSTDGILLNGFSASGNFVDRFTVLHPEEVISVTAGGLNGMVLLPVDEFDGRELPYHIGTADIEELTGEPVDHDALDETNQLLYMGGEDDSDTIGFGDAWTDDTLEQLALDVYGDDMITDRFPTCQRVYEEAGISAQFRVYSDAGHTPSPAQDDIVEFHRRSINDEDVSDLGENLVTSINISVTDERVAVDEEIEFDANDSSIPADVEILTYLWEFGDGQESSGETTTHSFEEADVFTVTLTVTTDRGNKHQQSTEIEVGESETAVSDDGDTADNDSTDTVADDNQDVSNDTVSGDDETASDDASDDDDVDAIDDETPGFGIGGAIAGIGGLAYMLNQRIADTEAEESK